MNPLKYQKKKEKKRNIKEFLKTLQNSFISSDDIYRSLEKYNINNVVKAFLKITKDRGNPILNIKSLSIIIADSYEIKKRVCKDFNVPFNTFNNIYSFSYWNL